MAPELSPDRQSLPVPEAAKAERWYSDFGRILLFSNPGCTNAELIDQQTASLRENTSIQLPFRNTIALTTQPTVEQTLEVLEENFRDGDLILGFSGDGGHGTLIGAIIEGGFNTAFGHFSSGGQNDQAHMLHPNKLLKGDPLQLLAAADGRLVNIVPLFVTKTAPDGKVSSRYYVGYYTVGYTADVTNATNQLHYRDRKAAHKTSFGKKLMDARTCLQEIDEQSFELVQGTESRQLAELSVVNGTQMAGQLHFHANYIDVAKAAVIEVGTAATLRRIGSQAIKAGLGKFTDRLEPGTPLLFTVGETRTRDGKSGNPLRDEGDGEDSLLVPGTEVRVELSGSFRSLKTKKLSRREILLQSKA